jgi:hypothetical protein
VVAKQLIFYEARKCALSLQAMYVGGRDIYRVCLHSLLPPPMLHRVRIMDNSSCVLGATVPSSLYDTGNSDLWVW